MFRRRFSQLALLSILLPSSQLLAQNGPVTLNGNSVSDNGGPFNGLGVTYMSALYWAKNDRGLLDSDLAFLASKEFKYIRILSEVPGGCGDFWVNRGIHPINYTSSGGCFQPAWTDYTAQLQYLLDRTYDTFGMRTEITVFGGAADSMPTNTLRQQHLDRVLNAIAGREHKVIHLEVANEGWQTGFPGTQGVTDMRTWCQYLTDRTGILTAISAEPTQTNAGLTQLYSGSTADIATQHYSRSTAESGWVPVRDCWETEFASGVPPASNNEPIGPGSSVNSETDPIRLVMAAAFSWGANLPLYVYHTNAGVRRDQTFQSMAGVGDFVWLDDLLPGNFANMPRNDGKEASAPFTNFSNGQANKWWPEVGGATSGCVRNTGKNFGSLFYTLPIGVLGNGLTVQARRPMSFTAYNPLTGQASLSTTLNTNQQVTIPQGPRGYIVKGIYTDVVDSVSVNLGTLDIENGIDHFSCCDGNTTPVNIGFKDARVNVSDPNDYMYFNVSDGYAFNGNKPNLTIVVDYFDKDTGTLILQYDSIAGGAYKTGPSVTLTNTNVWRSVAWTVTDAYFGNRENGGTDFRIAYTGNDFYIDNVSVAVSQTPFGGTARTIPGIIQAEDFDNGGSGVGYSDNDAGNNGGQYRAENVDIETTGDTGGGFNVGWTSTGEWLEYTVNVAQAGDYAIKMRVASGGQGGTYRIFFNGNSLASRNFENTGGWQTYTTIIIPGVYLNAGNNQILRIYVEADGWNFNHVEFTFGGADVVSQDLGWVNTNDGMTHPVPGDGKTQPTSIGGHNCRRNLSSAEDFYMYFAVFDAYAFQGSKNNAAITFDYFDSGTGAMELHYDGASNPYAFGGSVNRTNTNTWKTFTFNVTDAYFGNRQNNGADFRIYAGGTTFYIDTVMVFSSTGSSPPGQASNPNPANGATLVNRNADLSWSAGSGATNRDVRFGTANPPPFVINQTAMTYDPGTMAANTTYFWRIDEKNGAGTTTGVVWSFTTLPLPGVASNPNPANGATSVATNAQLSWTAGSNASSHDVRFGTTNPPPFVQNQSGTTYSPAMSPSTTYFWRIDEVNSSGTTTGTVWSFTTSASAPPAYFTNSSFENGFSVAGGGYNGSVGTGWTPYLYSGVPSDMTFADETGAGNFDTGAHAQKITAAPGKEGGVYNRFSVTSGQNYTVTVRVKSASPSAWCFFGINTSGGTNPLESAGTIYPADNGRSTSWQTFTWTGTATGTMITLFLDTYDGAAYWDTATPAQPGGGPVTLNNSAFPSNADGWNVVVWRSGQYTDGTMAWQSTNGNPTGNMRSAGSGGSNNTDSCTREGGEINKAVSTVGYNSLVQVQYDLRMETNQTAGSPCIGTCLGGVLNGDCADKLCVYFSTSGTAGPWTLLEQVLASSLAQNTWLTRTINCPSGANNQAGFAVRFRWQFNQSSDGGRLDNIKVIATP